MASLIDIHAVPTNDDGGVRVSVQTPEITEVSVYATPYDPSAVGTPWELKASLTSPGDVIIDLPLGAAHLILATGVIDEEPSISPPVVVLPSDYRGTHSVDVERGSMQSYERDGELYYRLRMRTTNPVNMSDKIFLYEQVPNEFLSSEYKHNFVAVCKPGDLVTYPEDEPEDTQVPPFFRTSFIDMVFPNILDLEITASTLVLEVTNLINALNGNHELVCDNVQTLQSLEFIGFPDWVSPDPVE